MDFVFAPQPTADCSLDQFDFSDAILEELASSLGRLRLEADRVSPALDGDLSITCSSRNKFHETRGTCVETTSITPMACTIQKVAEILWHHITAKKIKDVEKTFRFVRWCYLQNGV